MRYELKTPCSNCPFRADVRPYIHPVRVLAAVQGAFSCHKTTTCKERGNDHPEAQHCAGSLIMHEKSNRPHQMMRIAERLGFYDRTKMDMDAPVYSDLEEMLCAYEEAEEEGLI